MYIGFKHTWNHRHNFKRRYHENFLIIRFGQCVRCTSGLPKLKVELSSTEMFPRTKVSLRVRAMWQILYTRTLQKVCTLSTAQLFPQTFWLFDSISAYVLPGLSLHQVSSLQFNKLLNFCFNIVFFLLWVALHCRATHIMLFLFVRISLTVSILVCCELRAQVKRLLLFKHMILMT